VPFFKPVAIALRTGAAQLIAGLAWRRQWAFHRQPFRKICLC
jgi:hypothetical protein